LISIKHNEQALKAIREEIIYRRQQRHLENEREVSIRWTFENAVIHDFIILYFILKIADKETIFSCQTFGA
jgi:hypothetical protein